MNEIETEKKRKNTFCFKFFVGGGSNGCYEAITVSWKTLRRSYEGVRQLIVWMIENERNEYGSHSITKYVPTWAKIISFSRYFTKWKLIFE